MLKLERFFLSFAASMFGIICYSLLTAPMNGGFFLKSTLIFGAIFGVIFSSIATLFAKSYWHYVVCAFATTLTIGLSIVALIGPERWNNNVANDGWMEVVVLLALTGFLPGTFAFFLNSFLSSKKTS